MLSSNLSAISTNKRQADIKVTITIKRKTNLYIYTSPYKQVSIAILTDRGESGNG